MIFNANLYQERVRGGPLAAELGGAGQHAEDVRGQPRPSPEVRRSSEISGTDVFISAAVRVRQNPRPSPAKMSTVQRGMGMMSNE